MGQHNRARRAAKQRNRQRAGGSRAEGGRSAPPPRDAVGTAVAAVRFAKYQRGLRIPAAVCTAPLLAMPAALVDQAVGVVVAEVLRALFAGGWTPLDLVEIGRRRVDTAGAAFLLDAVVATTSEYPEQLVDPRWRALLDQFGAEVWWDQRRPRLSQWAVRDRLAREVALTTAVDVLGLLDPLPTLDQVLPPPGTLPSAQGTNDVDPVQQKALAKVRALLAKAESTDFDDEAEALSAKAQELMSRYALDRALIDHRHGIRQQITLRRIWLDSPYVMAKSMLVDAVASANRCRAVLGGEWGYTTVVGDAVDLDIVELLATSLLLQATRAMLSTGSQLDRRGVSSTRSFRHSFLLSYAHRIGERLRAANEASEAATDASALLPVLSARSRAVDDLMAQWAPRLVSKRVSASNGAGWGAGRAAADLARLDVHAAVGARAGSSPQPRTA